MKRTGLTRQCRFFDWMGALALLWSLNEETTAGAEEDYSFFEEIASL